MDIDDDEAFLYGDSPPSSSAQVELPTISKQAGDGEVSNVDGPIGGASQDHNASSSASALEASIAATLASQGIALPPPSQSTVLNTNETIQQHQGMAEDGNQRMEDEEEEEEEEEEDSDDDLDIVVNAVNKYNVDFRNPQGRQQAPNMVVSGMGLTAANIAKSIPPPTSSTPVTTTIAGNSGAAGTGTGIVNPPAGQAQGGNALSITKPLEAAPPVNVGAFGSTSSAVPIQEPTKITINGLSALPIFPTSTLPIAHASSSAPTIPSLPLLHPPILKDGQSIYDYDLKNFEGSGQTWRRPGSDLTRWFNYGFDEGSWTRYLEFRRGMVMGVEGMNALPPGSMLPQEVADLLNLPRQPQGINGMNGMNGLPAMGDPLAGMQMNPEQMQQMMMQMMAAGGGSGAGMDMGMMGVPGMQGMQGMMGLGGMNPGNPMMGHGMQQNQQTGPGPLGAGPVAATGEDETSQNLNNNSNATMNGPNFQLQPGGGGMEGGLMPFNPNMNMMGGGPQMFQGGNLQGMVPPMGMQNGPGGFRGGMRGRGFGRGGMPIRGRGGIPLPTGPRNAAAGPPANVPTGPRAARIQRDRDRLGTAEVELDYGGGDFPTPAEAAASNAARRTVAAPKRSGKDDNLDEFGRPLREPSEERDRDSSYSPPPKGRAPSTSIDGKVKEEEAMSEEEENRDPPRRLGSESAVDAESNAPAEASSKGASPTKPSVDGVKDDGKHSSSTKERTSGTRSHHRSDRDKERERERERRADRERDRDRDRHRSSKDPKSSGARRSSRSPTRDKEKREHRSSGTTTKSRSDRDKDKERERDRDRDKDRDRRERDKGREHRSGRAQVSSSSKKLGEVGEEREADKSERGSEVGSEDRRKSSKEGEKRKRSRSSSVEREVETTRATRSKKR